MDAMKERKLFGMLSDIVRKLQEIQDSMEGRIPTHGTIEQETYGK